MVKITMKKDEKRVCEKAGITIEFSGTTYSVHDKNGLYVFGDEITYTLDNNNIATIRVWMKGLTIAFINYIA